MKVGIVADDLTGAADAAAPFANRGLRCAVAFRDLAATMSALVDYDVVSISTETRDLSPANPEAVRIAITDVVRALVRLGGPRILCKKIDSTLRGHTLLELNAICGEANGRIPIICPAFPAQRRTVVNRRLYVASEPRQYVYEAFDPAMCEYSDHLGLRDIRRGSEWVSSRLSKKVTKQAVFFEAETDIDLTIVAAAMLLEPEKWLPVGSAGFMGAIAAQVSGNFAEDPRRERAIESLASGPILYICGSRSKVSNSQVVKLERAANTTRVSSVHQGLQTIRGGSRVAIAAVPDVEQDRDTVLENLLSGCESLRDNLSVFVFATGGDTAAALLRRCGGFSHLDILGELEPGVVLANAIFQSLGNTGSAPMHLVLKAGAFGHAQTLARIAGL